MSRLLRPKAAYLLVATVSFFAYLLFVVQNSFQALYHIYSNNSASIASGNFWSFLGVFSEYSAEVGLILRFVGSCLFVAFAAYLLWKDEFRLSTVRKAVLLESTFYLFNIPFDINHLIRPTTNPATRTIYYETTVSYILQLVLISTTFLLLYYKMRQPNIQRMQLLKYGAIAATAFSFGLWVKHFFFNLYALPINFNNPVLIASFLNSTVTILIAALIIFLTLMPVIRGKTTTFNQKTFGVGLILIGVYFIIYLILCTLNSTILAFLPLIELWAVLMPVLGIAFIIKNGKAVK